MFAQIVKINHVKKDKILTYCCDSYKKPEQQVVLGINKICGPIRILFPSLSLISSTISLHSPLSPHYPLSSLYPLRRCDFTLSLINCHSWLLSPLRRCDFALSLSLTVARGSPSFVARRPSWLVTRHSSCRGLWLADLRRS